MTLALTLTYFGKDFPGTKPHSQPLAPSCTLLNKSKASCQRVKTPIFIKSLNFLLWIQTNYLIMLVYEPPEKFIPPFNVMYTLWIFYGIKDTRTIDILGCYSESIGLKSRLFAAEDF